MTYQLVPLMRQPGPPVIALHRPVLLIGRHPESDCRIDLPKISRAHCCVAVADDRVVVRDLGSRNGIRVNGQRVEEARLHPGDEIALGPLIFRLVEETPQPIPQRPAARGESSTSKTSSSRGPGPVGPRPGSSPVEPEIELVPLDDD